MISGIYPGKSVHGGHQPDKKRQTGGTPVTTIVERGEDLLCGLVRSQVHKGDQEAEESQNVKEEHQRLDLRQKATEIRIDKEREGYDRVK